jgi:hypothetical protein
MAPPLSTMTVTVDVPLLAELLQANHDLRREVSDLRTQLSTRVQAIETQLVSQRTDNSTLTIPSQDLGLDAGAVRENHRHEHLHVDQDLDFQTNGSLHQNVHAQQDFHVQQDNPTQQNEHVDQDGSSRATSRTSPSIDKGLTIINHVSLPPAAGHKRKRTAKSAVGTSPYINHSGFVVRGSDTQLAQRRAEDFGPSRSESPFDSTNDHPPSSDQLEIMPPVRPQSRPPVLASRHRLQRPVMESEIEEADTFKSEEVTIR